CQQELLDCRKPTELRQRHKSYSCVRRSAPFRRERSALSQSGHALKLLVAENVARLPRLGAQPLPKEIAGLLQECPHEGLPVVRIGQSTGFKGACIKARGALGVTPFPKIDAVSITLGRAKNKLARGKDAGIKIRGSRPGKPPQETQSLFDLVRPP